MSSTETISHSSNYRYQHLVFSRNHLQLPDPFCSGGIAAIHPPHTLNNNKQTKNVFTPLTKQLQSHEGEHEKAKHEEQEDIGDLWQCIADAAEGSSYLSQTKEVFRSTLPITILSEQNIYTGTGTVGHTALSVA